MNSVKTPDKKALEQPFIPEDDEELTEACHTLVAASYLLGQFHAEEEIPPGQRKKLNAADEDEKILAKVGNITIKNGKVPFAEAVDFLKSKVPMTKAEWNAFDQKLRFRAFTVAKLGTATEIETAKQILADAVEKGESYAESWETLKAALDGGATFKPGYWETVFRTNTQSAYTAGKLAKYEDTGAVAYQLLVVEDERTSKICRHLLVESGYGAILPVGHNFWKKYGFPPYHFNCRTSICPVYQSQIGTPGYNVENIPMKRFSKFKPQKGFGANPLSSGSFWLMSDNMKERALNFGLVPDIVKMAHNIGLNNYDFELASNFAKPQQLQKTKYKVKALKKAKPKQKEILTAKILEENGHSVVMLPEVGLQNISNPDALIDFDIVADFKVPDGNSFRAVRGAIQDADEQSVTHMVFYPREHNYTKQNAVKEIAHRLKATKKLKEVWLIWNEWDGLKITVVKK